MHMTRCTDAGRRKMLKLSVSMLVNWMYETCVDSVLIDMVQEYLMAQDSKLMADCLHCDIEEYRSLAEATDNLRWDSFIEGRLSPLWLEVMRVPLREHKTYLHMTPERWGSTFIEHLLSLTHKQWIFRNSKVHFKKDGHTEAEHKKIFDRVEELMHVDPDLLLPRHKHLLEIDFEALGEGQARGRKYWIAKMDSAVAASVKVQEGWVVPGSLQRFNTPVPVRVHASNSRNRSVIYRQSCRRSMPNGHL